MKFIPIPGEWGILGIMQVFGFFIPIPAIPGNTGNGNGNSREFFIPRTSLGNTVLLIPLVKSSGENYLKPLTEPRISSFC